MNQRIKELAERAGLIASKHDDLDFKKNLTTKEKKFAELIVKECAKLASEETSLPYNSYSEKIKRHFGVEE